jgi:uncharacterized spore protein YtfJ
MNAKQEAMETGQTTTQRHPSLIERLAEKLGGSANVHTVYGDAVIRNGVTVIPVAKVAYGLGGGSGVGEEGKGSGEGGGGGVSAMPVGYIEINDRGASFHRILDPMIFVPLIAAGGVAATMILRGIYRIMKQNGSSS